MKIRKSTVKRRRACAQRGSEPTVLRRGAAVPPTRGLAVPLSKEPAFSSGQVHVDAAGLVARARADLVVPRQEREGRLVGVETDEPPLGPR